MSKSLSHSSITWQLESPPCSFAATTPSKMPKPTEVISIVRHEVARRDRDSVTAAK